ncbi:uncharacterized protein N7484_008675 [Penicillium longicatenatum]|uniref:uncharacterized protein n=1 Tax=Penicillium longicatenatum TaxID=1561947 RepID=UPI002548CE61|nr:uncharacterized protein N7484_008675 [Penicillium longicatenatum]KAJ5635362.1 hypothetical protein N7484_008675 [Penicillium longicatenatum]
MSSRYASSPGRGQLGRSRINSSAASSVITKKKPEPEGKHESAESDVDDTPQTSGEKRKSPESELDPSNRPTRRTRPSPESERLYNSLQSHDSLQSHNAKAQETSDPADVARALPEEASYNSRKSRRTLENLDFLQFHDALKSVETESVRGPETTSSAGSIVSPQNQAFANYREGAGHSATTIEGISPPVPLAQEPHGGDLWVHHEPVSPPKSYLSGKEQRLNNMLTAVGHSRSVRLRNLSISSPRPPVPNSESYLSMQSRAPPKMDPEKHSRLAIGMPRNVKPSSELSGKPPTSSPAFTPSSKTSPEDLSPPSPVGSPPNINWAAMQILTRLSIGHTDSVEKHSPFHVHPPSHPKKTPRAKATSFSRQSNQDRPVDGGVYQSVKKVFGSFLGGLPKLPLINLIPVFNNTVNVPEVEIPPANLPPLNLRAEISGYDSADNVSNDYTKKETMGLRKRSIHFETNRPKSEAEELKQLSERKKRQLDEIEELEVEINWLMEFGTEQEEKVGELEELLEELEQERDDLEEKIGNMMNELGELREIRDDLTRDLNRGWAGQDRLNRRTWDTKGDTKGEGGQSWSRRRKNLSDGSSPTRYHERR